MTFLLIGAFTGIVMGLTGAGGALVALPLFMVLLSVSLQEASVLSLVAVVIASGMNFIFQRQHADLKLSLGLFFPSVAGSFLAASVKGSLPELVIKILLVLLSLFALYGVWFPLRPGSGGRKSDPVLAAVSGFILGVLTTITGLGGGVILLPLLLNVFRNSQESAVSTSLLVICLSSSASFGIQFMQGQSQMIVGDILFLSLGILLSALTFHYVVNKLKVETLIRTRQIVFSCVVIFAIGKIFSGN